MGFAILWIMLSHLHVSFDFIPLQAIKKIGYAGVDIFLFLSGFGLYYACSKDNFSKRQYYKNRFKRILPEFWLVLIVVYILRMDFSWQSFYALICHASTLGLWVWGAIPYTKWYISCILLFYAIYPRYFSLFQKYGIIAPLSCIGGGIFLMISYALISMFFYNKDNVGGDAILAYARIPIFFLGSIFGWLAKNDVKIVLKRIHKIMAIAVAILLSITLLGVIKHYPSIFILRVCSINFVPFIIITPVLCIILAKGFEKVHKLDRFFAYIGTFSLELYLCHMYIYGFLFDYFIDNFGQNMAVFYTVFLSCLSAYILYFMNRMCLQRIF